MINPNTFIRLMRGQTNTETRDTRKERGLRVEDFLRMGTLTFVGGYVALRLDGETNSFAVPYNEGMVNTGIAVGDRVVCLKVGKQWVVMCGVAF